MAETGADHLIDWDLAVATATRLTKPGPEVDRIEAKQAVHELRNASRLAESHVRDYTGLRASSATSPVLVVDRPGWIQANADGFRDMLRPLLAKVADRRLGAMPRVVGSRVTGLEIGGLLGFLSSRVLGQFDPFDETRGSQGRLLLVVPNIVEIERLIGADPTDFRMWVCLHEETHRVQFTAVEWLRRHMLSEMETLLGATDLDPARVGELARSAAETAGRLVRGDREASLIDIVSTPEQKTGIERLTALMSLLEGHADVVMDGVGPSVVPSVDSIRRAFERRRTVVSPADQLMRRLLGLDAKLAQYRDGAAFVRGAMRRVGMDGFNAVWTSPETLPTSAEISDPGAWVRRVHG